MPVPSPCRPLLLLSLLAASVQAAGPSGGGFAIGDSNLDAGGSGMLPAGGGFQLTGTLGGFIPVPLTGGGFRIVGGFQSSAAARADLAGAYAFHVPFVPSAGHDRITFGRLTNRAVVRIYTLSGESVHVLEKTANGTGELIWSPVENSAGERLASGVYHFVVEADGVARTGWKLMVIR